MIAWYENTDGQGSFGQLPVSDFGIDNGLHQVPDPLGVDVRRDLDVHRRGGIHPTVARLQQRRPGREVLELGLVAKFRVRQIAKSRQITLSSKFFRRARKYVGFLPALGLTYNTKA